MRPPAIVVFASVVDRRNLVPRCERDDALARAVKERIVAHDKRICSSLAKSRKDAIEVRFAAGIGNVKRLPDDLRSGFNLFQLRWGFGTLWVDENTNQCRRGHKLAQESEPLREQLGRQPRDACSRATWPTKARH